MGELFDQFPTSYWYALLAATPRPETGESANVGILIGNGRAYALRYLDRLPRLCGLAASDEVNVYQSVLKSVADLVGRGMEVSVVSDMLAPQITVGSPRPFLRTPDDASLEFLARRYLSAPEQPAREANPDALIRKSLARLDAEIAAVPRRGVGLQENVRPKTLYEGKIDRFVGYTVPRLARALRGFSRDLLLDSLVVEHEYEPEAVRGAAGRIGQAFYAYDRKLRRIVKEHAGREIRLVGVLQPGNPGDSAETLGLREYIGEQWSQHARVIDGNKESIESALAIEVAWAGDN